MLSRKRYVLFHAQTAEGMAVPLVKVDAAWYPCSAYGWTKVYVGSSSSWYVCNALVRAMST